MNLTDNNTVDFAFNLHCRIDTLVDVDSLFHVRVSQHKRLVSLLIFLNTHIITLTKVIHCIVQKPYILTMSHFFPSSAHLGGFAAGATVFFAATGDGEGEGFVAMKGFGPVRSVGFLCVFISSLTFFNPEMHNANC